MQNHCEQSIKLQKNQKWQYVTPKSWNFLYHFLRGWGCFCWFSRVIERCLVWFLGYNRKIPRYKRCSRHIWHLCYTTPVRCYIASLRGFWTGFYCFLPFSRAVERFLVWFSVGVREMTAHERYKCHLGHMCYTTPARCYFAVVFWRFSGILLFFTAFFLFSHGIEWFLVPFFVFTRKIGRYDECSCRMWHMCYSTSARCYFAVFLTGFSALNLSWSISHAKEWFSVWFWS